MADHYSVLTNEVIEGLAVKPSGTYIDCTLGNGGHAEQIAAKLNTDGRLIALDQDADALEAAKARLAAYHERIVYAHANFRDLERVLDAYGITHVEGVLFDLGVSSPQLDRKERGFSYQQEGRLDMRMDQTQSLDARSIVNEWSYNALVSIFFQYGEERFAKSIARKIESQREKQPIHTTFELVDIIKDAIPAPARRKGPHPAKRTFQALRIAVNDELGAFNDALHQAARKLSIGGRMAVLTFHSLEDRICKKAFVKWSKAKETPKGLPITPEEHSPPFRLPHRKPIFPSDTELRENARSRSAKLRVAEKIKDWDETFTYQEGWKNS